MRIGFLAWNTFQVAHFAPLMAQFDEPDVIFTNRNPAALDAFDPQWLTRYGAYSRFVQETDLAQLDGQYDAILTQNTPPIPARWKHTKLVMSQYSMAKPKTAYNGRWLAADAGLVYGSYSARIIGQMCPVVQGGNPRFDPVFDGSLDAALLDDISSRLDHSKQSVLFLPTWGDLSSGTLFQEALDALSQTYNVLYKPHHITQHGAGRDAFVQDGLIDLRGLPSVLDLGPYLLQICDVVVSDMSGAIFDALYCRKPVVLLGLGIDAGAHNKADTTALEVSHTDRIGPVVRHPAELVDVIAEHLDGPNLYTEPNETLVSDAFTQRGGCAVLAADGLRRFLSEPAPHHDLQAYVSPATAPLILNKAYRNAVKRGQSVPRRRARPKKLGRKQRMKAFLRDAVRRLPPRMLSATAQMAGKVGYAHGRRYFSDRAQEVRDGPVSKQARDPKARDLGLTAIPKNANEKLKLLKQIQARRSFFALGNLIERWVGNSPRTGYAVFYQYYCAASNLRYSRARLAPFREGVLSLASDRFFRLPETRRRILRDLGHLELALAMGKKLPDGEHDKLSEAAELLGAHRVYLDQAAQNERVPLDEQLICTPDGTWISHSRCDGPILEMSIMLGFARLASEEGRANRAAMIAITRRIITTAHEQGWSILPRLQAGYAGAVPITGRYSSVTWHTTDTGVPGQLHLKVGSYSEYIILDDCGYSGWSSLARKPLDEITRDTDIAAAEAQFDILQRQLIAEGKTKYAQSDSVVPDVGRYVFLPMQVMTDAVARLAYIDGLSVLEMLIEWTQDRDLALVVKRHPKCKARAVRKALDAAAADGQITLSDAPIHDLIAGADAIVTVNSGAGAEALLHLKPVITTGRSDYAAATVEARTKAELFAALDALPDHPVGPDRIKAFLVPFTRQYQLHPTDVAAIDARLHSLLSAREGARAV